MISKSFLKKYQILKYYDSAVVLVTGLFQECDTLGLHGGVVALEVVRVKEEPDSASRLTKNKSI
jgi:hypothetical protein